LDAFLAGKLSFAKKRQRWVCSG